MIHTAVHMAALSFRLWKRTFGGTFVIVRLPIISFACLSSAVLFFSAAVPQGLVPQLLLVRLRVTGQLFSSLDSASVFMISY